MYKKELKQNRLNAVYYARVSTEEEKQVNALAKQCDEAEHCISSNKWVLVDKSAMNTTDFMKTWEQIDLT